MYDGLYSIIAGTGIWTIPFIIVLYKLMMGRESGDKYDCKSVLIASEIQIYTMIAIVFIFLVPSVSVSKTALIYNEGAVSHKSGDTGTTFDDYDPHFTNPIKVPPGWYVILYSTAKVATAFKQLLPTGINLRQAMYQIQKANVDNPELQELLQNFDKDCAAPSRGLYNKIMSARGKTGKPIYLRKELNKYTAKILNENESISGKIGAVLLGSNAYKIASEYPANGFNVDYIWKASRCTDNVGNITKDSETFACIPNFNIPIPDLSGCEDRWNNDVMDKFVDYYKDKEWDIFKKDNSLMYTSLGNSYSTQSEKSVGNKSGSFFQYYSEKTSAVGANIANFFVEFFNSVLRFYLPLVMGFILMILIMVLPIVILFSRYTLPLISSIGILFFGISMLPALWHIPYWFDNNMIAAVYGSKGIVDGLLSLESAALDLISITSYILITYIWFAVVKEIGGGLAITISGQGTGFARGGGGVSSGLSKAGNAKSTGTKMINKGKGYAATAKKMGATTQRALRYNRK